MSDIRDKHGMIIKRGDVLFNPHDRDQYHIVLVDESGRLFLGDYDSPLELYRPDLFWEIAP